MGEFELSFGSFPQEHKQKKRNSGRAPAEADICFLENICFKLVLETFD